MSLLEQIDPLWQECFDGVYSQEFVNGGFEQYIAPVFDGFIALCEKVYQLVCNGDKKFAKFVSSSMYAYYNTMHLWARIASIENKIDMATQGEREILHYLSSEDYPLHKPINDYLRGIGDFSDPTGKQYRFRCVKRPTADKFDGMSGFFGRVGSETHCFYESYPAPGVVATRIQEDLRYTIDRTRNINWDLPLELRPNVQQPPSPDEDEREVDFDEQVPVREEIPQQGPLPTANLLGWYPAERLTQEQYQLVRDSGVTDEEFQTDYCDFCLNVKLFSAIGGHIRQSSNNFQTDVPDFDSSQGSIANIPFIERNKINVVEHFDRRKLYSEDIVRAGSAFQLDPRFATSSIIMSYRIRKEAINGLRSWSCYDFDEYRNVPDTWNSTRNALFTYVSTNTFYIVHNYTCFTDKDKLRAPYIMNMISKVSSD